ncbi:MAG: DUF4760 domain-containing protein [Candidatus Binataceae bacterium]
MAQETLKEIKRVGRLFRLNIPISAGIFGASLLLVLAFSFAFFEFPTYRDGITFVALAVTAAGGVAGAFYVGRSLSLQLEQQKQQEAFALMARFNSPEFFDIRKAVRAALEVFQKTKDAHEVSNLMKKDENLAAHARSLLSFLEELAIAVRVGHVNEETTAVAFSGLVIRLWEAFQYWINEHRGDANRQDIWKELEILYGAWKKRYDH